MSARVLTVTFVNANSATVSGHGARDLLEELSGRPPLYLGTLRAWSTHPATARDVIAAAQARGWHVVINEPERGGA